MDLRQVRGFVAVAGAGTVTGAANSLGLAPATVSEQVRRLEQSLGVSLFERTPQGMRLTEQGATLLARAQGLLDHADEVRRAVTGQRRRVRIGALEMLAAARLPAVIRRLSERRPDLDVDVYSLTRQPLLAAVASGEVDAALLLDTGLRIGGLGFTVPESTGSGATAGPRSAAGPKTTTAGPRSAAGYRFRPSPAPDLDFLDVGEVRLLLVAAPDGDREPLLVSADGCSIRLAADRVFGVEVPRRELTSIATAREWARQGLGSALLPDFTLEPDLASGALVALDFDAPALALRLVWLRGREPALRDVLYAMSA
ncbi:LysR family transcriptional regulator [Nonomuraea sp. B19D2]|uniref:LysR family transcriptional regulator n=1 Tax=Nonomuraea sp. B19D2 TaxID=3159561 RepID=UPI0032DB5EFA